MWNKTFKKVYKELINEGVKAIMPGHISIPSIDKIDPLTNNYPPASLSKYLLTDILKNELGFEGIIISDAVNMSGFCGYMNYYKACARFLMSGGDCLLFAHPNEEFYDQMTETRLEQLKKVLGPMLVTLLGIVIDLREEQ